MKNLHRLCCYTIATFVFVFSLYIPTASASSVSYSIITATTTNTVSVAINTILKRNTYTCDLVQFTCALTTERTNALLDTPLREVTVESILEKEKNASSTKPYVAPIVPPIRVDSFVLPGKSASVTQSPDKKMVAYYLSQEGTVKTYHSYVLVFDTGKTLEKFGLIQNWDLITDNTNLFGFTSDSSKLVYIDDRTGFQQLYMVDLKKDPKNLLGVPLVTKKYTVLDFVVQGNTVYFIANRNNNYVWGLYALDLETRKLKEIAPDVMYTNNLTVVADVLLFTYNKSGTGILGAYDTKTGTVKPLTGIEQPMVASLDAVQLKNGGIHGSLIAPPKGTTANKKAIIWLHGGPYRQSSPQRHPYGSYATYDWILDEMVKQGTTVLKIDYPGSLGFGRTYAQSLVGHIGTVDSAYVLKAIQFLKKKGMTDVYLFGNSYGGYLSLKAIADHDKLLAGSVAVAPVTDWQKLIEYVSPTPFEAHFGGVPTTTNQKLYDTASIVQKADGITKPIVIFHGELDKDVPVRQSDYLFKALKEKNKNVTYYNVVNQGHVINGVTQNQALCQKLGAFIGIQATSSTYCVME